MAACIIRAIWSEAPPAPAATTISTGFVGSQATAGAPASMSASAEPAQTRIRSRVLVITSSLRLPWGRSTQTRSAHLWHDSDARQTVDHCQLHLMRLGVSIGELITSVREQNTVMP